MTRELRGVLDDFDRITRENPEYVDALYRQYREDPESLDPGWALIFSGYELGLGQGRRVPSDAVNPPGVLDLVHTYRELGHLVADIDPLGRRPGSHPLLALEQFGFQDRDLGRSVSSSFRGLEYAELSELIEALQQTYCDTLAVEFMHLVDEEERDWLLDRVEPNRNRPDLGPDEQKGILRQLIAAQAFERFLHTKYRGAKRFSLEGGDSLIPLLNTLVEDAGSRGVEEIICGMPHRGRLNVLAHVMCKPYELILAEFEGLQGNEDVKYHLGYDCDRTTESDQSVHISLSANPSHLESIDPVVEGRVRAKQEARGAEGTDRVIPVLMHGDAAFTGQGIVYETLELANLEAFTTGGTIHIIINNQLGFTTDPEDTRTTLYASDIAKMMDAPIFHVNADDPEAVVRAAQLALEYRQRFQTDVFIDFICYRQYGHNELDDPTFTQPVMYQVIESHASVTELYGERLTAEGVIGASQVEEMHDYARHALEESLKRARDWQAEPADNGAISPGMGEDGDVRRSDFSPPTQVDEQRLRSVADGLARIPDGFRAHRRVPKMLEQVRELVRQGEGLHWAAGENLAYGSLLLEGFPVRLTGQDSARGTFSHRHAVLYDAKTGDPDIPLNDVSPDGDQAQIRVVNSPLSELGVLGFEYGLSTEDPDRLIIWEAQYGDFANNAQTIIDQFIATGEAKWGISSGLVLLLPHGYEGQGPEHSSARLERFLQLSAEDNIQVVNCTRPAQFFHVLRRQMHRDIRKPLVVMSPKSLLRHRRAVSDLSEFTEEGFEPVLADSAGLSGAGVKRVLLCSGRVYYRLEEAREERKLEPDVAILRLEQLYPFPAAELREALGPYSEVRDIRWVQEEPRNQGAWRFLLPRLTEIFGEGREPAYVGRPESAISATGNYRIHQEEEKRFLEEAFEGLERSEVVKGAERQGSPADKPAP